MADDMEIEVTRHIDISHFDTSSEDVKFVASYAERKFEISKWAAQFIIVLRDCKSSAEAAIRLSEAKGSECTESEIELLYERCIVPIISPKQGKTRKTFLWSKELIPAQVVALIPRYLKFLFNAKIMIALVALIVIAEVLFFTLGSASFSMGQVDIFVIVGILLLFVCSSIVHEFGHATASSYCGAEPKGIGLGLYINFPVFYTDVSDIWKLSRKHRTLVNFGGVYFQLLFLLPLFVIYFITGSAILKYFIFTVNLNFILTLNPFFKFDGYWIMSDLMGVPNLSKRSKELFSYYWKKLRGKDDGQKPYMLSLKKTTRAFFVGYSAIVNLFFLYYFCYIIPRFLVYFVENFPAKATQLGNMIVMGQLPPMSLIMGVLGQLVMLVLIIYMLYKMIKPLMKKILTKRNM